MRERTLHLLLLAGASVTLLAGCSGTATRLGYADQTTLYTPDMIGYAAPKGELATVVRGNPFGGSIGDPEAIAAAIKPPARYGQVRLTTRPGPGTPDNYRLVLIFDPPVGAPTGDLACNDAAASQGGTGGGPVRVQASFCIGGRLASQITGTGAPASDVNSPAFQDLMGQVMENMFPPVKRDIGESNPLPH